MRTTCSKFSGFCVRGSADYAPYISHDDALKLDRVREALLAGDLATASQYGKVYELSPVAA
ncbi:MAG: hypothetical protein HGA62_00010 [Chlorobiaceae bacterium]|nr:hypothetical protein [Chlorobiaceae bacterium]